jgi:hypothetical protein
MIGLGTQPEHGRSPPRVWKTVTHSELKSQRNAPEDELLGLFAAVRPKGGRVTVVAERGCSDLTLDRCRTERGGDDMSRCRGVASVEAADGERRQAKEWLGAGGQMRVLRGTRVTAEGQPVPLVVCGQPQHRQEPWLLASRRRDLQGPAIKPRYRTRFTGDASVHGHHLFASLGWHTEIRCSVEAIDKTMRYITQEESSKGHTVGLGTVPENRVDHSSEIR